MFQISRANGVIPRVEQLFLTSVQAYNILSNFVICKDVKR